MKLTQIMMLVEILSFIDVIGIVAKQQEQQQQP